MTTTTVAEPDWDTRTNAYLEQQVDDAIDAIFEDAECCRCDRISVAVGTMLPCGHEFQACKEHRREITTHHAWRTHIGRPMWCRQCRSPVPELTWRPR